MIKHSSNKIYNVIKDSFKKKKNAILLNFTFIEESWKKSIKVSAKILKARPAKR